MSDRATDINELLLQHARKGDCDSIKDLLTDKDACGTTPNTNCKGKHKSNLGWSPLHLAAYFGHKDTAELLLKHNADVNILNGMGDTPLHRAAFTGRMDVVMLLLQYQADVSVINGEGRTALQMTDSEEVRMLIHAAEKSQQLQMNEELLTASRDGDMKRIKRLMTNANPPNINCRDLMGNTPLHCAAYRGHTEICVLLLQNGVDSTIKNNRDLIALDLARDPNMKRILDIQPLQDVHKNVQRMEGFLTKRSKLFGWRKFWIVLERGILSAFHTRADAASGVKRQFFMYLDHGKLQASAEDHCRFKIQYSDHTIHYWSVAEGEKVTRQKWINAFRDHCAYSTHYTGQPHIILLDELDENFLPLGSMQDALKNSKAHQQLLDQQVASLSSYFNGLQDQQIRQGTASALKMKLADVVSTSLEVSGALNHCLSIMSQQEEVRRLQLQAETEKRRVLEDCLHVVAEECQRLEAEVNKLRGQTDGEVDSSDEEGGYIDAVAFLESHDNESFQESCYGQNNAHDAVDSKAIAAERIRSLSTSNGPLGGEIVPISVWRNGTSDDSEKKPYRTKLPSTMFSRGEFSIFSVLRNAIGMDLSRISMPVIFNEPLSLLQRVSEYLDCIELLQKAAEMEDPVERMLHVACFAIGSQSSTRDRLGKPFNPLLGETFELIREDRDIRLIAEQVSHHPPVSATFCQSSNFQMHLSIEPLLRFWGRDIEVKVKGQTTIEMTKVNDAFTLSTVATKVHNVIVGKMWIELVGEMVITSHNSDCKCVLNFKPSGWFGTAPNQVDGYVYYKNKKKLRIRGDWTSNAVCCPIDKEQNLPPVIEIKTTDNGEIIILPDGARLIWQATPKPPYAEEMYKMTEFAMGLNELRPEHVGTIAPTDARLRPDIRAMEDGDIEKSANEKFRLEEKQRAARRIRNQSNGIWETRWFELEPNPYTSEKDWMYKHEYFKRDWSKCPDIF